MALASSPAAAQITLSTVIVDFADSGKRVADVEVENTGKERVYVTVEPFLIVRPGSKDERRMLEPDPDKLGLLVTPTRLVLEPGERKLVRFAVLGEPGASDRIYRVMVKPVVGRVTAPTTAIKILIGFDVLVIQRPAQPTAGLVFERKGGFLVFRNTGNTNVLLFDGKQCTPRCRPLETKRIYAGGEWRVRVSGTAPVTFKVQTGSTLEVRTF